MIYRATWSDGRQAIIRAHDSDGAGRMARKWREQDYLRDPHVDIAPIRMEHLVSRDPAGVLMTGWKPEENPPT